MIEINIRVDSAQYSRQNAVVLSKQYIITKRQLNVTSLKVYISLEWKKETEMLSCHFHYAWESSTVTAESENKNHASEMRCYLK